MCGPVGGALPGNGAAHALLFLAIVCAVMGALRLPLTRVAAPHSILVSLPWRMWAGFLASARRLPWEEGARAGRAVA